MKDNIVIRPATKEDCGQIMKLTQELSDYEKLPIGTNLTAKQLEDDGFGAEQPFFQSVVAEDPEEAGRLIGHALFFFAYSTYDGRSIYMEDLYVTPEYRGKGIGMALWKQVVEIGLAKGCKVCGFEVLNWNKSSIDFYKSVGAVNATEKEGWFKFKLYEEAMKTFVSSNGEATNNLA